MTKSDWIILVVLAPIPLLTAIGAVLGWKNRRPKYRHVTYTRHDIRRRTRTWRGP